MTIRKKILLGLTIVALIGLLLGIVGFITTRTLTNMSIELHDLEKERSEASVVLIAHYNWRHNLTEAVLTESEFRGSVDPNTCALGEWLGGERAKNISDTEILSLISSIDRPHAFIHTEALRIRNNLNDGDTDAAAEHLVNVVLPQTQTVISLLTDISDRYSEVIDEKSTEIESFGNLMNMVIIALIAVTVVACILLTIFVTKSIVKPLIPLEAFMNKAATTGDITLTQQDIDTIAIFTKVNDEIGRSIAACAAFIGHVTQISNELVMISEGDISVDTKVLSDKDLLGSSILKMTDSLNSMFSEINSSSSQVTVGAGQVAHGSQSLAQGSTQQAASVQQLSASIGEVATKTKDNARMADEAAELTREIMNHAEKESLQMNQLMQAVLEITEASNAISRVIKVIDDIAFQTNILALNAAVEAARAGQHGKGFAVVAEEVRNLAAKSAESAKDTGALIENSIQKSSLGMTIATETSESLKEVVDNINKSAEIVSQIAHSSDEQVSAISQINIGIDQVSQVIQQNSATAEQSAAASEEMSGQATVLQELVKRFKLREGLVGGTAQQLPPQQSSSRRTQYESAVEPAYTVPANVGDFGKY